MTPEMELKVAEWRNKCALGTITTQEMIEAVKVIREGRINAAATAATTKTKAATKVVVDANTVLAAWGKKPV